jgi:hypothetical protein
MKKILFLIPFLYSLNVSAQILNDVRELIELNNPTETDSYPFLSDDGLRLYYTAFDGSWNNLYYSSRPDLDSDFEPKTLLDSSFFSGVISCSFSPDELDAYYSTGMNLFRTTRATTSSPFGGSTEITLVGGSITFIGGPTLTPGGAELYIFNGTGLSKYEQTNDTLYTFVSNPVPPAAYDGSVAQISKDGLELYWTLVPIGTDSTYIFKLDRPAIGDDFANPVILNNQINSSTLQNSQASYATSANVLIWVRNNDISWSGNDLFIAQNGTVLLNELGSAPKELLKIVDLLGRETIYEPNKVLIYIYSDGTAERVFKLQY